MRSRGGGLGLLLMLLGVAGAPVPAAAGPFTANGTQPGLTHALLPAGDCQACHGDFQPAHDTEPWPTWAGSMMAQSARDPLFWAALDVANHDLPGVGEFCLRCHVPTGWLAGRSEPPGGSADGCHLDGNLDARDGDFEGVGCHVCHRMMVNPTPPPGQLSSYLENGQFWLDDGDCGGMGEPCRRGPYDHPGGVPPPPPHAWAFSPYHRSAEQCGTCHNVTSPAHNLIADGADAGIPFPIERTYQEWLLSDFGQAGPAFATCQDCHMPQAAQDPAFACTFQTTNRAGALATHAFAGGNAWIPGVLAQAYPNLNLGPELLAARNAALDMLQNRSVTVEVTMPGVVRPGETAAVAVKVTNLTGHKLPTGYPEGRRMWLHVAARDGDRALLWESGAYDESTGVLAADPQRKVYEAEPGIWNLNGTDECDVTSGGGPIFHFVRNDCYHVDNRIPPLGFIGGANLEVRPVGYVYPETSPGSGRLVNFDVTHYQVPIPAAATSPVTVTATLRYQTASREYVDFLRDQAVTHGFPDDCLPRTTGTPSQSRGELLHDLWSASGRAAPVDMAVAGASAALGTIDPYLCWAARRTRGTPPASLPETVAYQDAYETSALAPGPARQLCAPATIDDAPLDPATHLVGHGARPAPAVAHHVPQQGLTVTDRFGTLTLDTTGVAGLLTVAAVSPGAPPPPPAAPAVDDLVCYAVRVTRGTPRLPRNVEAVVGDGLAGGARRVAVKRPRRLCVPANLGGPPKVPDARLVCYEARAPREPAVPGLHVAETLGSIRVDARRATLLCVPAGVTP